jgi:integrase/recombinase XerD
MANTYESVTYNQEHLKILNSTILTHEEIDWVNNLKIRFKKRSYSTIIEDLYKFNKNNYSTLDLAIIYNISTRQIQRILKELGINRGKSEAQQLSLKKQNHVKVKVNKTPPEEFKIPQSPKIPLEIPSRLSEFLNYLNIIKGKSKNTIDGYQIDLILFFRFLKLHKGLCCKDINFDEITVYEIDDNFIKSVKLNDIYAFLAFAEKQRNNSTYARARKVASIKSFFKYLNNRTKILDENPASDLESPKINKRNPVYLTLDESKNLLSSMDQSQKHYKRDSCIITLFLNCGLRLSELCSINISSFKEDTLTIIGKGNKERTVYLNKACLNAISDYILERNTMEILNEHKDALFISERKSRINKRTVEKIVKKYIEQAGLDRDKYTPHKLRHTAATLMYKHGNVDIRSLQKILGHENISTTQIYTHVDDEKLRQAVKANPLSEE